MKLAVIVTEFPKATETFIYRDLMQFRAQGAEIRLYHIAPRRRGQPLHGFAQPLADCAVDPGFVRPDALAMAIARHPAALARTVADIVRAYRPHPRILAKSLALVPKALAIAADARAWGASHVHAEFAGHPATAAWIGRRTGGLPYSVSCRAHDIFRTQALLPEKLGAAQAVRTVSAFGAVFLREKVAGMAARDIHVIHSSIDTARIEPVAVPPSRDPFRILYVGALEPKKGVGHLLDALSAIAARLGDWRCELIGHGPDADALKAKAAALGLGDRLHFAGVQPYEVVAEAYRTASVCVAPSVIGPDGRQEGIPNVIIEALANQRPAITTAISGIPELIRDGETGLLVPPGDAPALGAALLAVHADPQAALAMAKRGRAHVEAEFDLVANARRQLALFAG
ncbi:glycosyltransferase family 4 protein [Sphingomonas baiyangensis]|uniref:Glycosyltransferase family 4 protein n=1 Tax=Sphingomonas baiyangensis TaxID=2572576 RepID=A0A4U1L314_9SPHN|nr:glycosyltransferase family 4 protein [Sphingomonas baiyangensis]TKD51032.1 glycosyltransferase family 4 protein [Sphingomonas baiyangensis]